MTYGGSSRRGRAQGLLVTTAALALALTGCASNPPASSGGAGATGAAGSSDAKIAFLMPDQNSTRYEEHDAPGFKAELAKICPGCTPLYNNANADATKQQQQFNSAIAQGAKAIVLDPVDSTAAASLVNTAKAQGVKVIAYDRPIPSIPADYYVSFDNEAIGKSIAQSLVQKLKTGQIPAGSGILEVNGSRRGRADQKGRPRGARRVRDHDAGRVRHPRLDTVQGPGLGGGPDHPLRHQDRRRGGGQRRHGRRRDRRVQGRRGQPGAAGDRQRRHPWPVCS